ncbi:hypothetical protein Tco_0683969 [Tanacetum coccineum]
MLRIKILHDVVGTSGYRCGVLRPSRWKELSKESGSKILPCGDGSCWKAFKPVASLTANTLYSHIQRSGILHITPEFQSRRVTLAHKYDLLLEILCEPRPSLTGPALILSDTCCNYHPCSFLFTLTDEVETSVDMLLLP